MFPIDASMFRVLSTRKALLVVDPQNDFLSADGVLQVENSSGVTERIVALVKAFRPHGEVVWARSEFDRPRPANSEPILTSDAPTVRGRRVGPRGRRPQANSHDQGNADSPEAFLSGHPGRSQCVQKGAPGTNFHPAIQDAMEKRDVVFVKSHYSAFKLPTLVQRLRMKLVTEVYICGSLSNIGVHATACDAASHGFDITIIEDCCGYRSSMRHSSALNSITDMTGCDIISTENLLDALQLKQMNARKLEARPPTSKSIKDDVSIAQGDDGKDTSTASLDAALASLSIEGEAGTEVPKARPHAGSSAQADLVLRQLQDTSYHDREFNSDDDLNASTSGTDESRAQDEPPIAAAARGAKTQPQRDEKGTEEKPGDTTAKSSTVDIKEETDVEALFSSLQLNEGTFSGHIKPPEESIDTTEQEPAHSVSANNVEIRKTKDILSDSSSKEAGESVAMVDEDGKRKDSGPLCEGDTRVLYNVLPEPLSDGIFEKVRDEVRWQRMSHQGGDVPRLVAVQGEVDKDGSIPIYRHPADESPPLLPYSSTVRAIKVEVEKQVGHPLNHALIQFYRDGNDYISEHSDKTLDIAKGSYIVNVSLGAERTMVLRTKRPPKSSDAPIPAPTAETEPSVKPTVEGPKREVQRAQLPHNSMCKMGLLTNERWLHAIRQDKRLDREKTEAELAYDGGRISLTFRQIGTFLDRDSKLVWGQGATSKTREDAHEVINGQTPEAIKMLQAFGRENQSTEFDWDAFYGLGFDVLHISASPRLFTSSETVVNMRIQLMLAEYGVQYAKGSMSPLFNWKDGKGTKDASAIPEDLPIKFVDNDLGKSIVQGDVAIMLYIDRVYGKSSEAKSPRPDAARQFSRFQQGLGLLDKLRSKTNPKAAAQELALWEGYAAEADFIAGSEISLADFAFWPVLHDTVNTDDGWSRFEKADKLRLYYERVKDREASRKVLGVVASKESPAPKQ